MTDNSPILKRIYNIAIEYIKNPLIDISLIFDYLKNTAFRSAQHWPSWDEKLNLKYAPFHATIYPDLEQTVVTPKDANLWLRPRDNWWFQKIDGKLKNLYTKSI